MQNGDKPSCILGIVRKTVVLCFNDDVFQCSRLGEFKKHAVELAFFLDITYQYGHAAPFFESAELLHHRVVHSGHKSVPIRNP